MSGHSKWSTIKHKKAMLDARRGKQWGKLARAVTVAAKIGGGSINDNPRLRLAVDKAKAANMPKDTIEKAIKKGTGELAGESYEQIVYEGYAAGGVAVMCSVLTDNRNRTGAEIRKIFERNGGNLGATGCVAFLFRPRGLVLVDAAKISEERLLELVLEAGADDVKTSGDMFEITSAPESFQTVRDALTEAGVEIASADLSMIAENEVALDLETARKVKRLLDALDDQDDVQAVFTNSDVPDDVMAQLAKD